MVLNSRLLNKQIGKMLLILYYVYFIIQIVMKISNLGIENKVQFFIGAVIGLTIKVVLVLIYWYIFMANYMTEEKSVKITQLIVGFLLVMMTLIVLPVSIASLETFIIVSISIILINDYKVLL